MKIKRNFKVKTSSSNVKQDNPCTTSSASQNSSNGGFVIKSQGLGSYEYPTEEKIPEGSYISKITNAKLTTDRYKNEAIEVFYCIEPYSQLIHRFAGREYPPFYKECFYYIKQKYPLNSQAYNDFADSMSMALFGEEGGSFTLDDIIGMIEDVDLKYKPYSKIGGYTYRSRTTVKELCQFAKKSFPEEDTSSEDISNADNIESSSDEMINESQSDSDYEIEENYDDFGFDDDEDDFLVDDD